MRVIEVMRRLWIYVVVANKSSWGLDFHQMRAEVRKAGNWIKAVGLQKWQPICSGS